MMVEVYGNFFKPYFGISPLLPSIIADSEL